MKSQPTLQFTLTDLSPKSEFALLERMYQHYVSNDPWSFIGMELHTPAGTFVNIGGFNGNPSDLWLVKKGTLGKTKNTFWRVCFGSKRRGFRISIYDLRYAKVTRINAAKIAEEIGALLVTDTGGIQYFTSKIK